MKKKEQKISVINFKILSAVVLAVVVSVMACGFVLMKYSMHLLEQREIQKGSEQIKEISESIGRYARGIEEFSGNLAMSDSMQLMLKKKDLLSGVEYYRNIRDIQKILKYYVALRSSVVEDMYFIDSYDMVIGDITKDYDTEDEWYQEFLRKKIPNGFSTVYSEEKDTQELYFVMKVFDMNDVSCELGTLVIVLNYESFIKETLRQEGERFQVILLDSKQKIITSMVDENENQMLLLNQYWENKEESKNSVLINSRYYFHESIGEQYWELYGILDKNEITKTLGPVKHVFIIVVLLCIFATILLFFPIIYRITNPIERIIQAMRQVSGGDLNTRLEIHSNDEFKMMADVFNQMVTDINCYMNEAVEKEKQENELRMKLFMAQINPHFICNTLNAIIYQAQKIKAFEIVKVTRAFINIIQVTINLDTTSIATIKDEMKYIEDYMLISRFRYQDIADLIWEIGEGLERCRINRMILYPIVENSILHGIFPKGEKGTIKICVKRESQFVVIQISDDGIGMEGDRLREINEKIRREKIEGRSSIGLQNVNRRLIMLYGSECQMIIESHLGLGCITTFKIPYET